jgi:rhodanese-related sulfurtransferase
MLPETNEIRVAVAAPIRHDSASSLGEIRPPSAWALVSSRSAVLVDVRTPGERVSDGFVRESVAISWTVGDSGTPNPLFANELEAKVTKDQIVLFLCRSGRRSALAAAVAAKAGFSQVSNVLEGFNGWQSCGLPWSQQS